MRRVKVAVPTKGSAGLNDVVSDVFGRAKMFTVVEVENREVVGAQVIENPASSYKHGSGPIVARTLANLGVNFVLAAEIGPGALELLNYHGIKVIMVEPGIRVAEAIRENMSKLE
ncbi:MAG: NifB/NifX family molybdenum-iron cluster-binding protein [Candidatus Bathyarchaeia archaeon]